MMAYNVTKHIPAIARGQKNTPFYSGAARIVAACALSQRAALEQTLQRVSALEWYATKRGSNAQKAREEAGAQLAQRSYNARCAAQRAENTMRCAARFAVHNERAARCAARAIARAALLRRFAAILQQRSDETFKKVSSAEKRANAIFWLNARMRNEYARIMDNACEKIAQLWIAAQ